MKTVVVIPTYNERDNIGRLLPELMTLGVSDMEVLVVDSNSPDGTADVVKEFSEHNPRVHLLKEAKKSGLGGAYILGMRYAMDKLRADIVCEMDADLQHDPADLANLILASRAEQM